MLVQRVIIAVVLWLRCDCPAAQFLLSSCFDLLPQTDGRFDCLWSASLASGAVVVVEPFADMGDDGMVLEFAATRFVQPPHTLVVGI